MNIYFTINILVLFFAFLSETFSKKNDYTIKNRSDYFSDASNSYIFIVPTFLLLLIVTGLRGDFTPDYNNYLSILYIDAGKNFSSIIASGKNEIGFTFFNKIVSLFTLKPEIYMSIFAFIVLFLYFYIYKKESKIVWLSVILLLCFGSYYTVFNTMRQFIVGIMTVFAAKNIYNRNFKNYCIAIVFISLFHFSTLVMIPFYFLLSIRWNTKRGIVILSIFLAIYISVFVQSDDIVKFFSTYFYRTYLSESAFGIKTGVPLAALLRFIFLFLFSLCFSKLINFDSVKERVWFNAGIYGLLFSLLSIKIEMFQRFTYFFLPYMTLLFPLIISRIKSKTNRYAVLFLLVLMALIYSVYSQRGSVYYWYK